MNDILQARIERGTATVQHASARDGYEYRDFDVVSPDSVRLSVGTCASEDGRTRGMHVLRNRGTLSSHIQVDRWGDARLHLVGRSSPTDEAAMSLGLGRLGSATAEDLVSFAQSGAALDSLCVNQAPGRDTTIELRSSDYPLHVFVIRPGSERLRQEEPRPWWVTVRTALGL